MKKSIIKEVLNHLTKNKRIFLVGDIYIHTSTTTKYLEKLRTLFTQDTPTMSLPDFRDAIGQGRKFAQLILELALIQDIIIQDTNIYTLKQ